MINRLPHRIGCQPPQYVPSRTALFHAYPAIAVWATSRRMTLFVDVIQEVHPLKTHRCYQCAPTCLLTRRNRKAAAVESGRQANTHLLYRVQSSTTET